MEPQEQILIDAMRKDPADEAAKLRFEDFLTAERPDSIVRQFLTLEREIAHSYTDQAELDRLVDEYTRFRVDHADSLGDQRGCIYDCSRWFKLWLVSFNESRRQAVTQALRLRPGLDPKADLNHLPTILLAGGILLSVRDAKEGFLDFVRRYKGPRINEPEVQPDEVVLKITPDWIVTV